MRGYLYRCFSVGIAAACMMALSAPVSARTQDEANVAKLGAHGRTNASGERVTCRRYEHSASRLKSIRACFTRQGWRKFDRGDY